jgi:hypothetical protein
MIIDTLLERAMEIVAYEQRIRTLDLFDALYDYFPHELKPIDFFNMLLLLDKKPGYYESDGAWHFRDYPKPDPLSADDIPRKPVKDTTDYAPFTYIDYLAANPDLLERYRRRKFETMNSGPMLPRRGHPGAGVVEERLKSIHVHMATDYAADAIMDAGSVPEVDLIDLLGVEYGLDEGEAVEALEALDGEHYFKIGDSWSYVP